MRCPFCRIDSMHPEDPGGTPVDGCRSCGAAWFDPGEIRELTEGRFPEAGDLPAGEGAFPEKKEAVSARVARAWEKSASLSCPRCSGRLSVIDFQNTGIPVFPCRRCGGLLVPRDAVGELARRFGRHRKNAALYDALGTSMAAEMRRRLDRQYGADEGRGLSGNVGAPGLPVVVPLADAGETGLSLPVVTWGLLGLTVAFHLFGMIGLGGMDGLSARLALPSGAGFGNAPAIAPWLAPFFHGGILPLAVGCLFLFVLGDNVEDRLGHAVFFFFYLACGVIAGAAHLLWGKAGAPAALGSAGAVAGVLGAYIVFFPQVPISMYGGGRILPVPAYLFACAWAVAQFLWGWGPMSDILNPAPYSLAGNLGGFAAGAAGASLWRFLEDRSA
jgi:membrane associated rhomboid family serine protease